MINSSIFLVNLPDNISKDLLPVLKDEHLGNVQSVFSDDFTQPLNTSLTHTDYIIFYIEKIDEENIAKLNIKEDVPTLLITTTFSFEMERTAKAHNINAVVDASDGELIPLIYGFIRQHDIYRFQHVLIVDDSRVDSHIVANILSNEFIHNEIELNTMKVIERLTLAPEINIIILDYEMPFKNGCQLMHEIKQTFANRTFIFIGLTGSRNGALKFLSDGADDVFIKPLDHELFALKLRKLIFSVHKMNKEKRTLNDYKNIINSITKEIYNPIYVLTTVNDCLLDNKVSINKYNDFRELSLASKEKLTHTFDNLLSYFAVSSYMQNSLLKSCSLQSMIATQLYLESSKDKLRNIIVNKTLDVDIKNLCVPEQIGQVINQLTHDSVMRSQNGGEIKIRLYTKNKDIVFEIEDAPSATVNKETFREDPALSCQLDGLFQSQPLNQLLCQKIIHEYDGSLGVRHESSGDVHFFKIPKKAFVLGNSYH